jgi:hypothetical protein
MFEFVNFLARNNEIIKLSVNGIFKLKLSVTAEFCNFKIIFSFAFQVLLNH